METKLYDVLVTENAISELFSSSNFYIDKFGQKIYLNYINNLFEEIKSLSVFPYRYPIKNKFYVMTYRYNVIKYIIYEEAMKVVIYSITNTKKNI